MKPHSCNLEPMMVSNSSEPELFKVTCPKCYVATNMCATQAKAIEAWNNGDIYKVSFDLTTEHDKKLLRSQKSIINKFIAKLKLIRGHE